MKVYISNQSPNFAGKTCLYPPTQKTQKRIIMAKREAPNYLDLSLAKCLVCVDYCGPSTATTTRTERELDPDSNPSLSSDLSRKKKKKRLSSVPSSSLPPPWSSLSTSPTAQRASTPGLLLWVFNLSFFFFIITVHPPLESLNVLTLLVITCSHTPTLIPG